MHVADITGNTNISLQPFFFSISSQKKRLFWSFIIYNWKVNYAIDYELFMALSDLFISLTTLFSLL